jgi:hypothetical protein
MAEALGVAAGAAGFVSLAIQLGDIVIRLRDIWGKIKNSGEEIGYLIEEIDILSLLLREVDDSARCEDMTRHQAHVKKSLSLCRSGMDTLSEVLLDLNQQICKQRLAGGLKASLKTTTITRLKERLTKSQSLLMLSYQFYSE